MRVSVNGRSQLVLPEHACLPLSDWLRCIVQTKSVKVSCGEGGCGACAVFVKYPDGTSKSINSCLTPVFALDGLEVVTAEGLPANAAGEHPIAERLAGFHASQCGFCTPGIAVACHTALAKAQAAGKPAPTCEELRNALDGNLCRCTGYRPIIAACTSFASDVDMEDLGANTFKSSGRQLPAPADCGVTAKITRACEKDLYTLEMAGGQRLLVPRSLDQLTNVLATDRGQAVRLVAGNTGAGVYKNWPTEDTLVYIMKVPELSELRVATDSTQRQELRVGAAVTLQSAIDYLHATSTGETGAVWGPLASHMSRIAGTHVRSQATVAGNLILARRRGLPSDVATLLLALGASVEVAGVQTGAHNTSISRVPLTALLDKQQSVDGGHVELDSPSTVVTATTIPVPAAGSSFWSNRVASRWANAASVINAAALRPEPGSDTKPTFVLGMNLRGTPGPEDWCVSHCTELEAILHDLHTSAATHPNARLPPSGFNATAARAAAALSADLDTNFCVSERAMPAEHAAYLRSAAEGLMLQALAAHYFPEQSNRDPTLPWHIIDSDIVTSNGDQAHAKVSTNGDGAVVVVAAVRETTTHVLPRAMAAPAVAGGRQELPEPDPALLPMTEALPKESAVSQARGLARYTDDVPEAKGALYGAWVTSPVAKGVLKEVDTSACESVPGYVGYISSEHVPGSFPTGIFKYEPLFPTDIEYHGQPVALVLADTPATATRAAALAVPRIDPPETPAIITAADALARGSNYPLAMFNPGSKEGRHPGGVRVGAENTSGRIQSAPRKLLGQTLHLPSQTHMYMETLSAVAEVDEEGSVRIYASTQSTDVTMLAVAKLLGLPQNKVEVICRRAGGGFGGKVTNPERPAGAAAIAALRTGRQVRVVTNRNTDLAMCGGRCQVDVTYDVGFDSDGRIHALDIHYVLIGGAYPGMGALDSMGMQSVCDNVYDIPAFSAEFTLLKCNLPPRQAVRAPGDFPAVVIMESIIEQVAANLGLDPTLVRERNMRQAGRPGSVMKNGLGKPVGGSDQYSLPRMWQELQQSVDWPARVAAVESFNARNPWLKRGLSLVPCMYPLGTPKRSAMLQVYADGSVRVAHGGVEIGQGLGVKVLQTAAYALSQVLPESQRPIPLHLFRNADVSTYTLPHSSGTFGSTTSESACAAVREAAEILVSRLRPLTQGLGDSYTWQQLVAKACPVPGFRGPVDLQVVAEASLQSELVTPAANAMTATVTYGVALAEAEVDALTGDRQILSVDLLFDCGKPLNPGVDLGQIEGAFVFGMGMLLSEHVEADPDTGACTTNSTWRYKVPSATCVPQRFNVSMVKDSPLTYKGVLSAKAVGEPPLLLSCSVLFALEAATRAAAAQLYNQPTNSTRLTIPATPQAVKRACGTASLIDTTPVKKP